MVLKRMRERTRTKARRDLIRDPAPTYDGEVKRHGTYKIANRSRALEPYAHPQLRSERRVQRILESLRDEILRGDGPDTLRIRKILSEPREVYRLEIELPELGYQRVTLLERDILEELLAFEDVRARVRDQPELAG